MRPLDSLLAEAANRDVQLRVENGRLVCNAPKGALTPELQRELSSRKGEIIVHLSRQADAIPPSPDRLVRVDRGAALPLSYSQQRLWFLNQFDSTSAAYNVHLALRLDGPLDVSAAEHALTLLVGRHESLRTRFVASDGVAAAVVDAPGGWKAEHEDLEGIAAPEREAALLRLLKRETLRPFDLARGPLFRAVLIAVHPASHVLLLVMHHSVSDAWSLAILVREFGEAYEAGLRGQEPSWAPLEFEYVDYAAWHRRWLESGVLATQMQYWREQLKGTLPVVELPADRPRPPVLGSGGRLHVSAIDARLAESVKALGRREDATLFMVLLAAFAVLLRRYTGLEDLTIGTPTANRPRTELEPIVGFFASTLVLRIDLSGNPTFRELLARVRECSLRAYANGDVPFDYLVERLQPARTLAHSPLFQVLFTLQSVPFKELELPNLSVRLVEGYGESARFDLAFDLGLRPEGLKVYAEYNTDLFDEARVGEMREAFDVILDAATRNPDATIDALPIVPPRRERELAGGWSVSPRSYPADLCLHELIDEQASRSPDRIAVRFEGRTATYGELRARSNRIARVLAVQGIGRGSLVGICLDRSLDMVAALLGVMKAGAAYVPLDPAFPAERLAFMVEDAQLAALVTQTSLITRIPSSGVPVLDLEQDAERIAATSDAPVASGVRPEDRLYVIYTSGSTGTPKGVEVGHRSVVNFLWSMRDVPGMQAGDRLVSVTTLSFDIAGLELYLPLVVGADVTIASRTVAADGMLLARLLDEAGATMMQATPATWRALCESGWAGRRGFRILCGGEALSRELADRLLERADEVWNVYGPTETTIWSTVHRVEPDGQAIPIGRPIANTAVYILDRHRQFVPIGSVGELFIGGDGVALGYLRRPELTAERFVEDPFRGGRMYRTGDLARFRWDGTIEFLGRADHQVKVRGFRIELGDVETALRACTGVEKCAVAARPDASGEKRLVAYMVPDAGRPMDVGEIRRALGARLPDYMVPSAYVSLAALPLTPNGKLDRNALPEPEAEPRSAAAAFQDPVTEGERLVAGVWKEVLRLDAVGLHDNFFDLGGHSLLMVQVQTRLRARLGRDVTLVDLFQRPTVAAQAGLCGQPDGGSNGLESVRQRAERQRAALQR